jgi:hypothetical protein
MPAREMLLHLACVLSGLGVSLAEVLLFSSGHAVHGVGGGQPVGAKRGRLAAVAARCQVTLNLFPARV